MSLTAICFDLDGTLVDSEPLHYIAWAEELATQGAGLEEPEYYHRFSGRSTLSTAEELVHEFQLPIQPAALAGRKTDRFQTLLGQETPHPIEGADELLHELKNAGARLALVSGAYRHEVMAILQALGWETLFEVVISRDDVSQPKPHPEPYLQAVHALGLEPHQCYAVEDSETGMFSALRAGLITLMIRNDHLTLPPRPEPYHSFSRLASLAAWLRARQQMD